MRGGIKMTSQYDRVKISSSIMGDLYELMIHNFYEWRNIILYLLYSVLVTIQTRGVALKFVAMLNILKIKLFNLIEL